MTDRTLYRIVLAVMAALSLAFGVSGCSDSGADPTHATAAIPAVADDPATPVNESAVLDTSRIHVTAPPTAHRTSSELAHDYAREHGLADCTAPSNASLSDVFIVRPVHPVDGQPYGDRVYGVGLDAALEGAESGTHIVVTACKRVGVGTGTESAHQVSGTGAAGKLTQPTTTTHRPTDRAA